jgi:hypothetical protein
VAAPQPFTNDFFRCGARAMRQFVADRAHLTARARADVTFHP